MGIKNYIIDEDDIDLSKNKDLLKLEKKDKEVLTDTFKNPTPKKIEESKKIILDNKDMTIEEKEKVIKKLELINKKLVNYINKNIITLVDYEKYNDPEQLDPNVLNQEIKTIDKKSIDLLIVKCQRLFLMCHHKFYEKLPGKYKTQEEYAEKEHNISRMQLSKYLTIWNKLEDILFVIYKYLNSSNKQLLSLPDVNTSLHHVNTSLQNKEKELSKNIDFNLIINNIDNFTFEKLYEIAKIQEEDKLENILNTLAKKNISVRDLRHTIKPVIKIESDNSLENLIKTFEKKLPKKLSSIEINLLITFIDNLRKKFIESSGEYFYSDSDN